MTRRSALIASAIAACLTMVPAMPAAARSRKPAISYVAPMRVKVGGKLIVRGRGFSARRARNTIMLGGPGRRVLFLKPRRASRRRLVVIVPRTAQRLLRTSGGSRRATRLRLRAVVRKRFGRWTRTRTSPVIVPLPGLPETGGDVVTGGGGSVAPVLPCGSGSDWDGDLLSNSLEATLRTDPCKRDTDNDGVEDGFEYQSAKDLNYYPNALPLPYPGKRPYPNPLDPTDGGTDYDQDGLAGLTEYQAWVRYSADGVPRSGRPTTLSNMLYSDGLQQSVTPPPAAPNAGSDPLGNWALDENGDGTLEDGERDADGDRLGNWDEQSGRFTANWWVAEHNGTIEPKESRYPDITFLDNNTLSTHDAAANPDMDGDGVLDGADDADHDGLSNEFELVRPGDWLTQAWTLSFDPGPNSWAYVQPFNPCKPFNSERCHRHPPFAYYDTDQVPPIGPNPPVGYPDSHPDTPNG
ncbi:MAG: hypothetical protein ABR581_09760 [Thermoleophilaceae bacterium]